MVRSLFVSLFCLILLSFSVASAEDFKAEKIKAKKVFSQVEPPFEGRKIKSVQKKTVIRERYVKVAFKEIENVLQIPEQITLNLFDDTEYIAIHDRTIKTLKRGIGWIGHLDGVERSQVILIIADGTLMGSVAMPGANFQVRGAGDGVHVIEELDHSKFPIESEPVIAPQVLLDTLPELSNTVARDGGEGCSDITVLVAYTPEARIAVGGTVEMENLIALAVAETNQSYISSGINARLTLVHTMETQSNEAANSFSTDLNALSNPYDNIFNNVDAARNTYFADEVALIINNTQYCGLGYLDSSAASAFTVTYWGCATGYYSFGHEIGHNMGARHDWYVDDVNTYQKGFVNVADGWRTIMAYNSLCSDNSKSCSRIQYWSNPTISFGGDAMGVNISGPSDCVSGSMTPNPSSCAADNRTKLNATCSSVANFRVSPVGAPDLIVNDAGVDTGYLELNTGYNLSATVVNDGNIAVSGVTLRYYQSTNTTISCGDTLLGADSISSLGVDESSQQSLFTYAPSTPGTYFVGACVESVPGELDFGNNCSAGVQIIVTSPSEPYPPIPDLTVISPALSKKMMDAGELGVLSMTVWNRGNAPAESSMLRYYRSSDAEITSADTVIGTDEVNSLAVSGVSEETISFSAPMSSGMYWFGACVDMVADENDVYENCSSAVKLSVGITLFPWELFLPVK